MACYHPIPAYLHGPCGTVDLWPPLGHANLNLPCGSCLGCLTDRATDWARRAEHEAKQWPHNCFVTLTYNDEHKPSNGELRPNDLTLFLKRLRARHSRVHAPPGKRLHKKYRGMARHILCSPGGLRYLASGEYGDTYGRPHFHLCLFNCDFADKYQTAKNLCESPFLAKLWPYGTHKIGTLTGASAAYVAQYTIKKQGTTYHTPDGEILRPPFLRMSLKPALGTKYITKYKNDLQSGYLVTDGKKGRIPRAYKKLLLKIDPALAEQIQYMAGKHQRPQDDLVAAETIHKRKAELAALAKG
ncbi:MAG: replication initiator protein [Microvirus sp.]|nr:MAG: replication initiator protein [Microvirus sp.]